MPGNRVTGNGPELQSIQIFPHMLQLAAQASVTEVLHTKLPACAQEPRQISLSMFHVTPRSRHDMRIAIARDSQHGSTTSPPTEL